MAVVLGDLSRDAERVRLTLAEEVQLVETLQGLITALDEHPAEDLVIVGADAPLSVATDIAERYRVERPALGVILLRRRVELQSLSEALRAGIREVVPVDDAEALLQACTRSLSVSRQLRHVEARSGDTTKARVILVMGAKGGCGKTVVATNLAAALAAAGQGRVCLVDLNLDFGDIAIAMQVDPVRTISDALGMKGGLDQDGIRSMVIPAGEHLDLLLAPRQPADAEFISVDLIEEVLILLAEAYDFVVIDSPPALDDTVLKCLDMADSYVLVTTLDMMALKNAKQTLDTLDALGYPRVRWRVVMNRSDSHVGLTVDDVEKAIGIPISVRLPSSKDVPASINRGVPLVRHSPRHPFSRQMTELASADLVSPGRVDSGGGRSRTRRGLRLLQEARA